MLFSTKYLWIQEEVLPTASVAVHTIVIVPFPQSTVLEITLFVYVTPGQLSEAIAAQFASIASCGNGSPTTM